MKQKKTPKISVIMATYNRAQLLPVAIDSILKQTFTNWELIIVDDASTDKTPEVIKTFAERDPRIRYHRHQRNSGLAVARNTSVKLAQGTYIALQDDDDISLPQRLYKQAQFLDKHPRVALVGVWLRCFDSNGLTHKIAKTHWQSTAQSPPPLTDCCLMPMSSPCLMARRHVFVETPMRPFFRFSEDYDFLLRCITRYDLHHIPEILYHYRFADTHHQTISTQPAHKLTSWQYHCLAWASAYHRDKGWQDPVHKATTIDDALTHLHPQFNTQALAGIKKLTQEFSHHLLETPRPQAIEAASAFISRFASKQLVTYLIDHTIALCLFTNQTHSRFCKTYKSPIEQPTIQQHIRTLPIITWKTRLQHCIRHNLKRDFIALLTLNHRCQNRPSLLPLSGKVVFACLRRGRFSFIPPYLRNLAHIAPQTSS
ncbi:MAG: glycosyltransferase family 2 protein [Alphaproteobacteria bacterium GM202ARS2]|nr:glycosyltransferase family 2 protein [Alphaproteobacteria bacterium GM202ARS2]